MIIIKDLSITIPEQSNNAFFRVVVKAKYCGKYEEKGKKEKKTLQIRDVKVIAKSVACKGRDKQ